MAKEMLTAALDIMQRHAEALGVHGAAVAAYLEDRETLDWQVDLRIVEVMKVINADGKGYNFVGVVFQKACEAMDTHQNSGSKVRPTLAGECGWAGSLTEEVGKGYVLTAFSGGTSDQDVEIAAQGLAYLKNAV